MITTATVTAFIFGIVLGWFFGVAAAIVGWEWRSDEPTPSSYYECEECKKQYPTMNYD